MSGAIRRYSIAREYELASFAFEDAHEQFQIAQQARKSDAERRAKVAAAKYMSDGFRHLSLADQLLQEIN